jgi:hypothetical protein
MRTNKRNTLQHWKSCYKYQDFKPCIFNFTSSAKKSFLPSINLPIMVALLTLDLLFCSESLATAIPDYSFKSPSLNGNGYGFFQVALENEQLQRQQTAAAAIAATLAKAAAAAANTPLQQFVTNLEQRIYAQISQNIAASMFSTTGAITAGSVSLGAGSVNYSPIIMKDGGNGIQLTVFDGLNTTTIDVPMGQFTSGH